MSLYVVSKLLGKEQAIKTAKTIEYKWEYNKSKKILNEIK